MHHLGVCGAATCGRMRQLGDLTCESWDGDEPGLPRNVIFGAGSRARVASTLARLLPAKVLLSLSRGSVRHPWSAEIAAGGQR